jgi:diadenosine tetraphosphate (Ap4A) HIT family hydrolase
MLNEEQSKLIKKQLIKQIDSWNIDEQGKSNAKNYIIKLSEKELEEFLIKNKLLKNEEIKVEEKKESTIKEDKKQDCVFCMIVDGKIPSYKIDENETSIAVLEIKPLSKGHVIIIPKKHVSLNQTPVSSFSLAKEIAKKMKKILKPKEISISTSLVFGHEIVNVVPTYGNETGERKEVKKQELEELQKLLTVKKEKRVIKNKKEKTLKPKLYKFPRRIP